MVDYRAHPRFAVEIDAEIAIEGGSAKGRTNNISRGGFCMVAPSALAIGSEGKVRLALVFDEGQFSEQLEILCQVMWCTRHQGGYQIGVRFLDLGADMEQYLTLFMRYLEGPDPDDDESGS